MFSPNDLLSERMDKIQISGRQDSGIDVKMFIRVLVITFFIVLVLIILDGWLLYIGGRTAAAVAVVFEVCGAVFIIYSYWRDREITAQQRGENKQ